MTAISSLQSVHKKGLFGDHHKKKESDLLNISEIKNLSIVQIVQYKRSKVEINNIQVDNLLFPLESLNVTSSKETRILWSGPRTWLVVSKKENILKIIENKCGSENFAITDLSHSRAAIQIEGSQAIEVLKKGCPINFNNLKKNNCFGTVFHGITVLIDFIEDNPNKFNIFTLRSFGESSHHHITDSALEFGYVGK